MEYGERRLFLIKALTVYSNDKIGIIGENGAGKTTLLDIIAGNMQPSAGSAAAYGPVSYINQNVTDIPDKEETDEKYQWQVPGNPYSGGEVMRAKIADALAKRSDILICDEPTSNLDEKGIRKLEDALTTFKGAVLLVSHDRKLMDKVCSKIWEIRDGRITVINGNYSTFKQQQEQIRQNQQKEYDQYIRTKKSLEQALQDRSGKAQSMTKTPARMGNSEARLHRMDVRQRAGKVSGSAGNIKSRLDKLEAKDKVKAETNYRFKANVNIQKAGRTVVSVNGLSFSYGRTEILWDISFRVNRGDRVCITGDNGSGKTTLLDCIARGHETVRINPQDEIGYFDQNSLGLDDDKNILEWVMQTSRLPEHLSRTVLAELGIRRENVYKQIRMLSGGERSKTALAALLCRQCSLLILDEPTNYLDIYMLEALERMLTAYEGTLIFVSHDRRFRQNIASRILHLDNGRLAEKDLCLKKESGEVKTQITLMELKAEALIESKKRVCEAEHEKIEREYQQIISKINDLKMESEN